MNSLKSLADLNDREFENFAYDLLTILGMRNLVWRTPGADGGRDIQGEVLSRDFSGNFRREVWYVECKVRQASLSWPDVFEKIAYAQNHDAATLLICCSSALSPKCKDEISIHNLASRRPVIRFWERGDLVQRIESHPELAMKYQLGSIERSPDHLSILMAQGLKSIQAAYCSLDHVPQLPNTFYLAQAISEFCGQFLAYPFRSVWKSVSNDFDDVRPGVVFCGFEVPMLFPVYSLKVVVAAVAVVARSMKIKVSRSEEYGLVVAPVGVSKDLTESVMLRSILGEISIISNIEFSLSVDKVVLRNREVVA